MKNLGKDVVDELKQTSYRWEQESRVRRLLELHLAFFHEKEMKNAYEVLDHIEKKLEYATKINVRKKGIP